MVILQFNRKTGPLLLGLDLLSMVLIFNAVTYLRGVSSSPFLWALVPPAAVTVLALYLIEGYSPRADRLSLDYASLHLIACFFAMLLTLLLTFAFIPDGFELRTSRAAIIVSFVLIAGVTLAYRRILYEKTLVSRNERSLLFLGTGDDFAHFSQECAQMGMRAPLIHVDDTDKFESFEAVLTSIAAGKVPVEAIVIKESRQDLPSDVPMKLIQLHFAGIPTYTLEIFYQIYWGKIPLYRINPIWLFQDGFRVAREPVFERIKRMSDIVLSLLGIAVAAAFVGLAAIAIKLDDRGPVFFAQSRVGKNKVVFRLLKLRTMRVAGEGGDPYTRKDDARITRVGRFLRTMRLDELPQLWNVLRGDMSLIGPRAEWDRLVSQYEREIPCYHFRHLVKPGITGWAQVNFRYGADVQDTLKKLEYDLYYIRNFSFMMDASIVLKTFHVMLFQKGR